MIDIVEEILRDHGFNTLEHHGVKGMKWGHRKEYSTSNSSKSSKTGTVDPAVVYAGVYAAALVAYGAYHLKDSGKIHQFRTRNTSFSTNTALSKKGMSVNTLHKTVVKPINPEFGKSGTKMNCRRCTFAYEMRRRGLDVKATKTSFATGQHTRGLIDAINPKGSPISTHHKYLRNSSEWGEHKIGDDNFYKKSGQAKSDEIFKHLNSMPNGSRGELAVGWKFGGGHSLAWENVKGKTVVFDTQSGDTFGSSSAMARKFGSTIHEAASTRLDNKNLNTKFLGRWVQNVD